MRLTRRLTRDVYIYTPAVQAGEYIGSVTVPQLRRVIRAEVFPGKNTAKQERRGMTEDAPLKLIAPAGADIRAGDLIGIGEKTASRRITSVKPYPGHITAETELI